MTAGATAGAKRDITQEDFDDARMLVSDARVALLLLDDARHRVVKRLVEVPRDQSWHVTLIALALLANAVH